MLSFIASGKYAAPAPEEGRGWDVVKGFVVGLFICAVLTLVAVKIWDGVERGRRGQEQRTVQQ
jgi:hypothetical protein